MLSIFIKMFRTYAFLDGHELSLYAYICIISLLDILQIAVVSASSYIFAVLGML